jgi:diguanylate cyclase (GGDEF)-like protein
VSSASTRLASSRRATKPEQRFDWLTFAVATLVAAVILLPLVVIPQWLSKQARWDALRSNVGEISQLAASVVDGDLQRQLLDPANYSDELYNRALAPLVRFHSSDRDIFYVYTMVERDGVAYFVLDTAASPDLKTDRKLEASGYMERFDVRDEYKDDWLEQLAAGKTYVNPSFEKDDYGTFLTGDSPIYDSQGRYSGFVGVDFDLEYYFAQEARFRAIAVGSLIAALLLALAIGYLATRYYSAMRNRMQEFYENSIRDSLTGLLNRRGAIEAITRSLARHPGTNATLLVDIDNLKMINDLRGHIAGDAVIVRTADAIRQSIRDGDGCARLGGDEFIIFATECDFDGAKTIAQNIITTLSKQRMPLAGVSFGVSIGIAVHQGADTDFTQMYREADLALVAAREEGKSRIGRYVPTPT